MAKTQEKKSEHLEEEIQFISFKLKEEEFAVKIERVKEILKMVNITPIPKAPPYLMGLMNLRGTIIPILDLKRRLKLYGEDEELTLTDDTRILVIQFSGTLTGIVVDQVMEVQGISESSISPPPQITKGIDKFFLTGIIKDKSKNNLAMMLNLEEVLKIEILKSQKFQSDSASLIDTGPQETTQVAEDQVVTFSLEREEFGIHISAIKEILKPGEITSVPNVPEFVLGIQNVRDNILPIIDMRRVVNIDKDKDLKQKDCRILIVDINQSSFGLMVDRVNEVMRIPHAQIETTPNLLASYGKEIKGVAKLDSGQRLILIMDEELLISAEDAESIAKIQKERSQEKKVKEEEYMEKQFVVFTLHEEEFGITIEKVQEIFKINEITPVPKAPEFISGITNLRGNIIPVVDLRQRFGISSKISKEKTSKGEKEKVLEKILVVNIKELTIGLMVDNVQEVLRIPVNLIEEAPTLVASHVDISYLEGIAKLDKGRRIVLLLEINRIMDKKEFSKIQKLDAAPAKETKSKAKPKKKKTKKLKIAD